MRKKFLYLIAPLFFLACNFLLPGPASSQPTISTPEVYSTQSFTIVRIYKQNGDLLDQLTAEAQKAKELRLETFH